MKAKKYLSIITVIIVHRSAQYLGFKELYFSFE